MLSKKCVPCLPAQAGEGGTPALSPAAAKGLLKEAPNWVLDSGAKKISREFDCKDFRGSTAFVNKVAVLAESEGHHPDIHIFYDKVRLELSTHAADGLTENDFILAAKINALS
ncbi:MAG: Pterin-4-alpha-carbinolamine dehydratase [Candidatus Jorgensenbacteria bacterium GW2011_GWA1_48_11]|uniref:Putative pterin-4-alpha-carbinolamine dehydratase n=1 Tax=Candidatus Jorgensenbacteria bacterium GW2011_GWA1_48_11 TaxID=1618660 RepID=A0A0G1XAZ9_9BACT|nr:MAG: Pterin-4-alpha-carbinolamine dehydratase [Candidatus Jorgensenbacteria bacterium GW2011_GWA1_48_11]KKW12008.1 MAG: Pterin-4-alpha-carbinolamine dehydratase [Candidatus Jorgensenbacteria bacterium GW2011_GWB1_49_9]